MQIRIQYKTQARQVAGVGSEVIEVPGPCRVSDCIRQVAETRGGELKSILVDGDGDIHPTLLLFVDDEQVSRDDDAELADGSTLTILPPISGG